MLDAVLNFIAETHFEYIEQFLTALLPMSLTVLLHGQGMGLVVRYLKRFGKHMRHGAAASLRNIGLIAVVGIMLLTHFIEVVAWAMFYFLTGMLSSYRTAMYFSVNAYTTLGASNITLPGRWQGLDGFESMTAMLMFGWSTAMLAAIVQKIHTLDT